MKINDDALRAAAEAALPQIKCFFRWEIKDALSESHKNELELQVAISFAMPAILAYLSSLPEHAQSLDISAGHTQESEKNEHMSALPGPAQEGDSINPSVSTAPSHVDDKNVGGVPGEEGLRDALARVIQEKHHAGFYRDKNSNNLRVKDILKEAAEAIADTAISVVRPAIEGPLRERIAELDELFLSNLGDKLDAQEEAIDLRRQLGEAREALDKFGKHTLLCNTNFRGNNLCTCGLEKAMRGEGGEL